MKMLVRLSAAAGLVLPVLAAAGDRPPFVEQLRNGFYASAVDLDGRIVKQYSVDTIARLCFSSNEVIPCENLKRRQEWKEIIIWVDE